MQSEHFESVLNVSPEPPRQSSSPSQIQVLGMQAPDPHWKPVLHLGLAGVEVVGGATVVAGAVVVAFSRGGVMQENRIAIPFGGSGTQSASA